ncbi:hypothetical protein FQN60_004971 [Etheostoma spectabile]|uniref:Uncharacterized protein n=1 Tax=Etheostoma spectabile TaxID=54343 RepID=A0A5J5DL31_9PERO|nr:hypothetical protein FQN60_004971 [Etheostoma spectabile]
MPVLLSSVDQQFVLNGHRHLNVFCDLIGHGSVLKRVIQHPVNLYLSSCSVEDGVSEGQFVDVSRVSSSDHGSDGDPSAHHSLHHTQPPEFVFPMRVHACVIKNQVGTKGLQQPGEKPRELGHRKPVVGWELARIAAVMNYGKGAGFLSSLEGGKTHSKPSLPTPLLLSHSELWPSGRGSFMVKDYCLHSPMLQFKARALQKDVGTELLCLLSIGVWALLGPVKSAIPHSLFVRTGKKAITPCSFTVPTTAAPSASHPPSPSLFSPSTLCLLSPPPSISQRSLLTEHSCSPLGKHKGKGVVVVMTSFPVCRIGLWGRKCGSARGNPLCSYRNKPHCHCFAMHSVTLFGQHRQLFSTQQVICCVV